ncbi:tRNA (adenosine(37)-N6)-dimethylallyltransferase MiaA [Eionea flava]
MGPTASGKTDLAIALSQQRSVDIISVDSALIYRGMNIGTAKPTEAELAIAPHALIDICDPKTTYSVADFCRDAQQKIDSSHRANRIPVLVGGTMMYFNALLKGLADMPATDEAMRATIEEEARNKGWPALHSELAAVDAESASNIHPNHSQRIARALAVYRLSGKTMTAYRADQALQSSTIETFTQRYRVMQYALLPTDRQLLHQRIERRYQLMLDNGFEDEVRALYQRGDLHVDLPSMRSVGYRQMWEYLAGECDHATMVSKGVAATRQLAKRQLTWLRGWDDLQCCDVIIDPTTLAVESKENIAKLLNSL